MFDEPRGKTQWLATSQDIATEKAQTRLEHDCFLAQLANSLTILNGWAYLTQISSCRRSQQTYLGAMESTVQHIAQLMQYYRQNF